MNKLMGAHKFMFGNGPAPENLTDALFCYHFFIGNAMKGGVDGTKFTRFKKTIDSAFDSLSTSTTARRIIGIVFGNLADITNIQLLGPRS